MSETVERRLLALGLELPTAPTPAGSYEPFVVVESCVHLAGQTNEIAGVPTAIGRVPSEVSAGAAYEASRVCGLNLLAALRAACGGDLDRVDRCVQVRGFVNADIGFPDIPRVINGASELFIAIFGDSGRHARTAIGVAALPKGATVEVDAIFKLRP